MTVIEERMRPRARPDFQIILARAGIERRQLAEASGISLRTVDTLANPAGYGREGYTRPITAWAVARGYATLTGITEEEAYTLLFTEE